MAGTAADEDEGPEPVPAETATAWPPERLAAMVALGAVVLLGAYLRVQNLSQGGLERDDAWVALTAHVRLANALRMGATAPGFTMVERTWILLDPGSGKWAQMLPLAISVVGIVAMYALVRYVGLHRVWALIGAFMIAVSPIALEESTHVKQYGTDIVLCCVLLALYEGTRRRDTTRQLVVTALASFIALGISASILPVLVGVWLALLLTALRDRNRLIRVSVAGAAAAVLCLPILILFVRHVSSALHRYWTVHYAFITHQSLAAVQHTGWRAALALTNDLVGLHGPALTVATWVLIGLAVVGLTRGGPALAAALTIAVAVLAAADGRIPIGTGRTDEVLFPAIILLALFGAQRLVSLVMAASDRLGTSLVGAAVVAVAATVLVVTVAGPAVADPIHRSIGYPGVDLGPLVHQIEAERKPGDLVFVEALSRYPWSLAYPGRVRIQLGSGWGAGFTTVSTDDTVYIVPSEWWETGYAPAQFAAQAAKADRLWFVGTGSPAYHQFSHDYKTLIDHGWKPQRWIPGLGAYVVLMTR